MEVFALLLCMARMRLDNPFFVGGAVITGLVVLWIYVLLVSSLINLESWGPVVSPYRLCTLPCHGNNM